MGYFDSGLFHNLDKSLQERYLQSIPQKKLGTSQEVFNILDTIVKSPFINGSEIKLDGAIKIRNKNDETNSNFFSGEIDLREIILVIWEKNI